VTSSLSLDANDEHNLPVAAGVYFFRMEARDFEKVIKLVLVMGHHV
jgi:hypothetical protein